MPPRRGIFQRITDRIGRILGGGEQPSPPPRPPPRQPPREPPRPPPTIPGPDTPPGDREAPFREVWNDEVSERAVREIHDRNGDSESEMLSHHLGVFIPLVSEEPLRDQVEMWRDYVDAMVNGSETLSQNDFFARWDIAPSSFAWAAWRDAMGYGKK